MNKEWSEKNRKMQSLIGKKESFDEGIALLLELREDLFGQITSIVNTYPKEAFFQMPFAKAKGYHSKTLGYSLWHIFRIEDIVAHTLICQDSQVLYSEDWNREINSPIITTGNEVDEEALAAAGGTIAGKITVDFYNQGVLGAQYIIDKVGTPGKVVVIAGNEGGTQADARRDGAKDTFEKAGFEVVAVEQCDFDVQKAYDAAAALIDANPDIVGFTCGNDDMALGVVKALQEKEKKDDVMVVGVDFTAEAKAAIEDGSYDATVAMSPYLMGREGIIIMLKALEGQDVSSVGDSTPMAVVDASNVAQMDDWK